MLRPTRSLLRLAGKVRPPHPRAFPALSVRAISSSSPAKSGENARTDQTIRITTPAESKMPSSEPLRRIKKTLPSFSLEGKTAVITGGARGLGYIMTQALVESGADAAIIDLNGQHLCSSLIPPHH